MQRLREATDSTLLTNAMFKDDTGTKSDGLLAITYITYDPKMTLIYLAAKCKEPPSQPARKSQRYIDVDERLENDMQVTQSMQNFMHKKLNQILEKRIEFVDVVVTPEVEADDDEFQSTVQLFRDSAPIVLKTTEEESVPIKQKRRKKLKRRLASEDGQQIEEERLAAAAISVENLQHEVSSWTKSPNPKKHFEYVEHKSTKILHLKEPDNEFTKQRKKNNWSENKIARK